MKLLLDYIDLPNDVKELYDIFEDIILKDLDLEFVLLFIV
jgi:hypothetical protein